MDNKLWKEHVSSVQGDLKERFYAVAWNVLSQVPLSIVVVVKVRGEGGAQPPAPVWAPADSEKVVFYA